MGSRRDSREKQSVSQFIERQGGTLAAFIGGMAAAGMLGLNPAPWAVVLTVLSAIGALVGAWKHAGGRGQRWLALLWVSSLGLLIVTLLGGFSIGVFLLPGTLGALAAAITGTWRSRSG